MKHGQSINRKEKQNQKRSILVKFTDAKLSGKIVRRRLRATGCQEFIFRKMPLLSVGLNIGSKFKLEMRLS